MRVKVASLGFAVPETVETATQLAAKVGRSEKWIVGRTGVVERRIAAEGETMEALAARAASEALRGGAAPDLILNASTTPRQLIPDSSVFIQRELGLSGIPSYSIHATCLSFLAALHAASALIEAGAFGRVLVVSSETGSVSRNFDEAESAALIGDGAAAAVITAAGEGDESRLLAWSMGTWPEGAELTEFRGAGMYRHPNNPKTVATDNLFHMEGPRIYKMARRRVAVVLGRLLEEAGLSREDIDLVVPHQASGPALATLPRYGFPSERVVNIVDRFGNCIAASLPMALYQAHQDGRLSRGDRVLLLGTGAGLSVGGAVLVW